MRQVKLVRTIRFHPLSHLFWHQTLKSTSTGACVDWLQLSANQLNLLRITKTMEQVLDLPIKSLLCNGGFS
jgi:hypothetical protein